MCFTYQDGSNDDQQSQALVQVINNLVDKDALDPRLLKEESPLEDDIDYEQSLQIQVEIYFLNTRGSEFFHKFDVLYSKLSIMTVIRLI